MAVNEKQLGNQKLGLTELGKDVAKANEQLKSLGTGVNLDMSDVMTKEIKKQLDQLVKAAKNSGNEAKNSAVQLASNLQKVSKETISYANNTANAVKIVRKGYDELGRSITEITKNGVLTNKNIVTKDETDDVKRMTSAVSALSVAYKNLSAAKKGKDFVGQEYWSKQVVSHEQTVGSLKEEVSYKNLSLKAQGQINDQIVKAENAKRQFNGELAKTQTGFDKLLASAKSFVVQMVVMRGLSTLWMNATTYAKEYYDALNEIRMVTGMSSDEAANLGKEYIQQAKEMSVSSTEIATAAVEYYRQGQTEDAVTKNLEWTIKYAKVAGLEFTEAAEIMTAAMNSMDLSAQKVTDVFSYLGDASAAGADEIGIAMQKASASAQEAGVSFEWLGAYIATVSEKTRQAPEVVGTAFNTMMARLHNVKAAGFDEEDGTRINDVAKALATLPEPLELINSLTGEWADMSDIFAGIAEQWDTLSDKQRAYIATTVAGTRQQNIFLTLMDDMSNVGEDASRAYELYAGALKSAGSATGKYVIYQDSVTASLDGMKASWEDFVNIFNGGEVLVGFYNSISVQIDMFTEGTKSMGGWNQGLTAAFSAIGLLIPMIYKLVTAIKVVSGASKAISLATATSQIGLAITAITALAGVFVTLSKGMDKVSQSQSKIDYSSQISTLENNIGELGTLVDRYEELAEKVQKTDAEYSEMESTINRIKELAPSYAAALESAQGNINQSIAVTNEALKSQIDFLQKLRYEQAYQEQHDSENQKRWASDYASYFGQEYSYNYLADNKDFGLLNGSFKDSKDFVRYMDELYSKSATVLSTDELQYLNHVEQLISDWNLSTPNIDKRNDEDAWSVLYTNFVTGIAGALLSSARTKIEQNNEEIIGYVETVVFGTEKYSVATNAQKQRFNQEITRWLEAGALPESILSLSLHAIESIMYGDLSKYYTHQDAVSAIENSIEDKNALQTQINKTWQEQQRVGFVQSPPVFLDSFISEFASELQNKGLSTDDIASAFGNMKSLYGEGYEEYLVDLFQLSPDVRAEVVSRWADGINGIEEAIRAESLSQWENAPPVLTETNWTSSITDALIEDQNSIADIESAYRIFFNSLREGYVTMEDVVGILNSDDVGLAFKNYVGQINGVIAKLNAMNSSTKDVEDTWSGYIASAQNGGEEYTDNLQKIWEQMRKNSELRADLELARSGGKGSAEATARLYDEFGTTDLNIVDRFISQMCASLSDGMRYLYENSFTNGADTLIKDLETYCTESGYTIGSAIQVGLIDAARMSKDGADFLAGNYSQRLYDSLIKDTNMFEAAAAIRTVTLAVEEGTITWAELIAAIDEGATASELFAMAYKDALPDPTENQEKWIKYSTDLSSTLPETQISTMKSIKEEAQSAAESVADLYRVTYGGDSDAYGRLYDKYGTTKLSQIRAYLDAEIKSLEMGASVFAEAGQKELAGYMLNGNFYAPNVMVEQLQDTIKVLTGTSESGLPASMVASLLNQSVSPEQVTAALWLMNDALQSGYLSYERFAEAVSDGNVTMVDVLNLFDEASMLEKIDQLKKQTGMTETGEKVSFLEYLFGIDGLTPNVDALDSISEVLARLKADGEDTGESLREALDLDEDVWKDIEDGGEMAEDSLKAIQKQIQKLKLKKMEEAGEIMEGMSEAFELAEKGGSDYHDKVIELQKTMTSLADAQDAYNVVSDTSLKGTEQYTNALSTLGSYVNMDSELLESNLSLALNKINADASFAQASLAELVWAQYAVSGSYFDPSTWTSGLITLSNGASSTTQNLAAMINTMLMAAGATIQATLNANGTAASINVTGLGTGKTFTPPSATGSKGGGGGGGGGGGSNASSEEDKMLSHMNHLIDIIARKLEALDSIMSQYETEGYITGLINGLEMENELLEEQNALYQDNLSTIDDKLASLYAKLATTKKGSKEYDKLLGQIETLEDAYNEFTLSMLDNESAIIANEKAIKDYYDEIRDMEIDLRETILDAIEDRVSREEDALDARIDMEEEVLDAIIKRHEKERDQILETTEMQIEALEKEKDALDEALDARKRAAEEEDKQLQLKKLEAQQTRISADPTRAKEALEIQKQIADLRDEIAWDEAEKEVEAQKDSIDQRITSLEDYAEYIEKYYSDLLENPRNFLDEVNKILSSSHEQIVEWLKQYSEDYSKSTDSAQKSLEDNWNEILNTMNGITITHWEEVEKIISQGDEAIIKFLKENSQDYREAGKLQAEAYVDEWTKKLQDLHKAYLDMKPELPNFKETDTTSTSASKGGSGGGGGGSSNAEKLWYIMNGTNKLYSKGFKTADEAEDYRAKQQQYWENSFTGAQMSHAGNETLATYSANVGKWKNAKIMEQFKLGGLASFTGPAWLDGSLTAPERVLSPYQTKLFENMVAALQKVATVNVPSLPFIASPEHGSSGNFSFGDIVINVDKLESDADYEEMAKKVGEVLLRQMNKGSYVGGIRYSF